MRDKCLVNKSLCRPGTLIVEKQRRMRTQGQCEGCWRLGVQGAVEPAWGLGAVGLKVATVFQKVWASALVTRAL